MKTDVFWKAAAITGWLAAAIAMGVVYGLTWGGWPL